MKIKVLLIMPGKEPQVLKIPASFKFIKALIGNNLYKIKLEPNVYIIANNNANHDEFNRILGTDIILGTFMILSIKNQHLWSLKKKLVRKYTNAFRLRKHYRKISKLKDEFLEEYYSLQRERKQMDLRNTHVNIAA